MIDSLLVIFGLCIAIASLVTYTCLVVQMLIIPSSYKASVIENIKEIGCLALCNHLGYGRR